MELEPFPATFYGAHKRSLLHSTIPRVYRRDCRRTFKVRKDFIKIAQKVAPEVTKGTRLSLCDIENILLVYISQRHAKLISPVHEHICVCNSLLRKAFKVSSFTRSEVKLFLGRQLVHSRTLKPRRSRHNAR